MPKPSESLRRARRWARVWKRAATRLYRMARTFRVQADAWQMTAKIQEQFALRERRWHVEELQIQRLMDTPSAACAACILHHPTYRSSADRKIRMAHHMVGSVLSGDTDVCRGSYKPPVDSFKDEIQ